MEDNRMKNCKRLQVIFTSVFCSCAAVSIGGTARLPGLCVSVLSVAVNNLE